MTMQVSPAYGESLKNTSFVKDKDVPELTNTRDGVGNTLGIAIRTDKALDTYRNGFNNQESEVNILAHTILHGAGHNSTDINKIHANQADQALELEVGHDDYGIMKNGASTTKYIANRAPNTGITQLQDPKEERNVFYQNAMKKRYGNKLSKDNYESNKSKINSGLTKPAYLKR